MEDDELSAVERSAITTLHRLGLVAPIMGTGWADLTSLGLDVRRVLLEQSQ